MKFVNYVDVYRILCPESRFKSSQCIFYIFLLSTILFNSSAYAQCPSYSCANFYETGHYSYIDLDDLEDCDDGSDIFIGTIAPNACTDQDNNKCFRYVFKRSTDNDLFQFELDFASGTTCSGDLDAAYFEMNGNCIPLNTSGTQSNITVTLPIGVDSVSLFGCLRTGTKVTLCGICEVDANCAPSAMCVATDQEFSLCDDDCRIPDPYKDPYDVFANINTCPANKDVSLLLTNEIGETSCFDVNGDGKIIVTRTYEAQYSHNGSIITAASCTQDIVINLLDCSGGCSLACNGTTQVSLDINCRAEIFPETILNDQSTSCAGGSFIVVIRDQHDNVIPESPIITSDYIGETLKVSVYDEISGNTCWGYIEVEDKYAPYIEDPSHCDNEEIIDCASFNGFSGPTYIDGCEGKLEPILISEVINVLNCDVNFIKEIIRVYTAVDSKGNYAQECTITYKLRRINLDPNYNHIECPTEYVVEDSPNDPYDANPLNCNGKWNAGQHGIYDAGDEDPDEDGDQNVYWDDNMNGYPDVDEFPVPTINGVDFYPFPDVYCNIGVFYDDLELPKVGCVKKIMRTWSIREWWCGTENELVCIQLFEITDEEAPVIDCKGGVIVTTNVTTNPHDSYHGTVTCGAELKFPIPKITDNCDEDIHVDLTFYTTDGGKITEKGEPFGQVSNYDPNKYITLPMGEHIVRVTAYDNCYNSSTCDIAVDVVDDTPPVAICDEFTVVSLTSDGRANVFAETFDDGSYDDCKLKKMLVRRMDPTNCECDYPTYPDVKHIGEYEGHHYYISHKPVNGLKAYKLSEAMGGYLVSLNDEEESEWVRYAVNEKVGPDTWYHIGLSDKSHEGYFKWADGTTYDSGNYDYNPWAPGMPSTGDLGDSQDYVVVAPYIPSKPGGPWHDVNHTRKEVYVFELEDPCTFSEYTTFCCDDVGTDQMVVFRVIDVCGNYNDCMVNASIDNKLAPQIYCPDDMTVNCDFVYNTDSLSYYFGEPTINGNCGFTPDVQLVDNLNQCNVGELKIIYTATGTDPSSSASSCTQIIHFVNPDPFTEDQIKWPKDVEEEGCFNPDAYHPDVTGYPVYIDEDQCDLVGANWDDQVFVLNDNSDGACFKILRTWKVIDWCQLDTYDANKTWTSVQIIKVYNTEAPGLECPDDIVVCTYDEGCEYGAVNLTLSSTGDDCTEPDNLIWGFEIDLHCNGSIDTVSYQNYGPLADASDTYPLGKHCITWTFSDQCGNPRTCLQYFTVFNCKTPTPYCINGLAVDLMPVDTDGDGVEDWGMVELWASDFDAGSFHPCGNRVILSVEADTTIKNLMFDCTTLGEQDVQIWSTIVLPDGSFVQSYCETYVVVQDNNLVCPESTGTGGITGEGEEGQGEGEEGEGEEGEGNGEETIAEARVAGSVSTEENEMVSGVSISLVGSDSDDLLTDEQGTYAFDNMPMGGNYVVDPSKNDDPLNGVSTLDLVGIQRHILGSEALSSPYKMIAADINNDSRISTIDLIELRKLILEINTEFPDNTSWRFIDSEYVFADTQDPFASNFPEDYDINSLENDMNIDFIGIKVGDVNNTVTANFQSGNITSRSLDNVIFTILESEITAGQSEVNIYAGEEISMYGFQFTLNVAHGIQLLDVESDYLDIDKSNMSDLNNPTGKIAVSWNDGKLVEFKKDQKIMTFVIDDQFGRLNKESFSINSSMINAEIYTENYKIETPVLGIEGIQGNEITYDFKLFQNTPNPFTGTTNLRFTLPKSMDAKLVLTDTRGKVVYSKEGQFQKGMNEFILDAETMQASGVLYYTLEAEGYNATKKMVVIR